MALYTVNLSVEGLMKKLEKLTGKKYKGASDESGFGVAGFYTTNAGRVMNKSIAENNGNSEPFQYVENSYENIVGYDLLMEKCFV